MTRWMQKYVNGCQGYALYVNPKIWQKSSALARVKSNLAYDTDYGDFSYSNHSNPFYNLVQADLKQITFLQNTKNNYVWHGKYGFTSMPTHYHYFLSSKDYTPQEINGMR